MKNSVFNFSLHKEDINLPDNLNVGSISKETDAIKAAQIADESQNDIFLVKLENKKTVGAFMPDYLKSFLPKKFPFLTEGMSLEEMITEIEEEGYTDFHSEMVNIYPSLYVCSMGHLTEEDPCPKHKIPVTKL